MGFSKAVTAVNYCQILTLSSQIPYGVLSACLMNSRLKQEIDEDVRIISDSALQRSATDEELATEIKQLDERYLPRFRKVDISLVAGLKQEFLPVVKVQGEKQVKSEIDVREVVFLLEDCGIIQA